MMRNIFRFMLLTLLFTVIPSSGFAMGAKVTIDNADIIGAGATFPAPLYNHWIKEFHRENNDFTVYYDAVGSGAGVKRFTSEQVDFGASDSAMSDAQIGDVQRGVQLIPATAGIIVLAYNLPDFQGELRLSREVYIDIFLGKIRYWNDERIQALNPGIELPRLNIVTITRSDSSGTTLAFTNHLSSVNSHWKSNGPGLGKKLDWPGNSMAARYNEGVAMKIKHSWGSIGYVEYGVAKRAGVSMALLENREGQFVKPSEKSGAITLANTSTEMPANLRFFIPDPKGKDSYPIVTYSWFLLYKTNSDKQKVERVKKFVEWGLLHGQKYAPMLGYTPLPENVVSLSIKALNSVE